MKEKLKTFIYRDNRIVQYGENDFVAVVLNENYDIIQLNADSLKDAKELVNDWIRYHGE